MKKLFLWLLVVGIVFFLSMQISTQVHSKVLYISDGVKSAVFNLHNNVVNFITRHFNQASQIKHLTNELKNKEALEYQLKTLSNDYNHLLNTVHSNLTPLTPNLQLVRTISYAKLNDYYKIWIESKIDSTWQEDKIFGLMHNNQAKGIVIFKNNRLIGYLNGDAKCNYSVIIGEHKLPGIAKKGNDGAFVVDYIPLYPKVKIGDKIYTSGHDEIFHPNLYVGEVLEVKLSQGYQIAIIKPENHEISLYYWLINRTQDSKIEPQNTEIQSTNSNPS